MKASDLSKLVAKWRCLGEWIAPSGAVYFARAPHVAPFAWLHKVYAPLPPEQQRKILTENPVTSAYPYTSSLTFFNGASLFSGTLDFYGVPSGTGRGAFDIVTVNYENPQFMRNGFQIIGSFRDDWVLQAKSGGVHLADQSGTVVSHWPSIHSFSADTIALIEREFDDEGKPISG